MYLSLVLIFFQMTKVMDIMEDFFEDDELEAPTFRWWHQDRRTGFICADV